LVCGVVVLFVVGKVLIVLVLLPASFGRTKL
jgi:hypothetical protein